MISFSTSTRTLAVAVNVNGSSPTLRRVRLSFQWIYCTFFSVTFTVMVLVAPSHSLDSAAVAVMVVVPALRAVKVFPFIEMMVSFSTLYVISVCALAGWGMVLPIGSAISLPLKASAQAMVWVFFTPTPDTEIVAELVPSEMVIVPECSPAAVGTK